MSRKAVFEIATFLLLLCVFAVIYFALLASAFASPNPARTFKSNRETFELIANSVMNGIHPAGADYEAADRKLQAAGVSHIRKRGKCLGFYLASLPPDAKYEILYSPGGFSDLPIGEVADPPNRLLELKKLENEYHWYYWIVY